MPFGGSASITLRSYVSPFTLTGQIAEAKTLRHIYVEGPDRTPESGNQEQGGRKSTGPTRCLKALAGPVICLVRAGSPAVLGAAGLPTQV